MKTTVRIIAVLLLVCMLGATVVACGKKLSGTYSAEIIGTGVEYVFDGSKVSINLKAAGIQIASAEGTYSIDGDKITFESEVQVSPMFLAWCCSFGDKLKVSSPPTVLEAIEDYTRALYQMYKGDSNV